MHLLKVDGHEIWNICSEKKNTVITTTKMLKRNNVYKSSKMYRLPTLTANL